MSLFHIRNMHLVLIHRCSGCSGAETGLRRFAISNSLVSDIVFAAVKQNCARVDDKNTVIAVPEEWYVKDSERSCKIMTYSHNIPVPFPQSNKEKWLTISDGRFITAIDNQLLAKLFSRCKSDIITINVAPVLSAYREKPRLTSHGFVAGFRRIYSDSVLPQSMPEHWPHHVFVKNNVARDIFADEELTVYFDRFVKRCSDLRLSCSSFLTGGDVVDLDTQAGLLNLMRFACTMPFAAKVFNNAHKRFYGTNKTVRILGKVICGDNVLIGDDATIIGPAMICDNVTIGPSAVINDALIGSHVSIAERACVRNCVLSDLHQNNRDSLANNTSVRLFAPDDKTDGFRYWPLFSYARFSKRVLDIIISLAVLTFFAPVFLLVALAIKLTSSGPVFFGHKRRGLHDCEFSCFKFRTMIVGADKIQEKLKRINQVDGPQFKIDDDPRVTVVGKFLRETFIDELPQFINILLGQMSVIGPRPSPQAENLFCPSWRYARLSVRPGITGLWQVCRTRLPGHDFQEWIYYDTKYIKNISLRLDLQIFWKTAKKLITSFIEHF